MTFLQKIKARIVDKFSGGVRTKDIRKQLDSLVSEDRSYTLKHLPHHMVEAGRFEQLHQWLTDFDFIEAKVSALGAQALIEDYDLAFNPDVLFSGEKAEALRLIQGVIRLSAHILDKDKTQLAGQLLGRLLSFEVPEIQVMLEMAKQGKGATWLRPLTPTLTPPGEPLLRTLTGHTQNILAVAVIPDGKRVISGSGDNTLKMARG
jgi:WD40 repeat protein